MMKYTISIIATLLLLTLSLTTQSCKKKNFASKGNLEFSKDTVVFDTVFTTVGSTTQHFKVYNRDNKTLTIDEIELVGGASSPFRMNFDGLQGTSFTNIEIEKNDSLYCFVEVTLNVNGGVLPLIIEDSIRFRTNGKDQYVKLAVWGQDAYFHYNDINPTGTWPNDKPHVIYGVSRVLGGSTLTIPAGTDVFLHKLSALYINQSTLIVNGTASEKVTFQGDRLEQDYDNVPGQYYGIYLDSADNCLINHAEIKNGITGIHVESKLGGSSNTTLTLRNTEIWNSASYGMLLFDDPKIIAENVLIHSNAVHAMIVLQGADMKFTHCNLLGYGGGDGSYPAVGMRNYYTTGGVTTLTDISAEFNNCVIYGGGDEELVMDTIDQGGVNISFLYRNCDIRLPLSNNPMYNSCLFNQDPVFKDSGGDDFTFWSTSALRDAGNPLFSLALDLVENTRDGNPDIGVYEYQ
ncbi:MAG: right-handed parallel beta-helix repeat-containing protein [Bacteroidota bacterium]